MLSDSEQMNISLSPQMARFIRDNRFMIDWSQCPGVESVPDKLGGAWVFSGTRMPVSVVFENLESGASIENILEWFPGITRTQIETVLGFAAERAISPARRQERPY